MKRIDNGYFPEPKIDTESDDDHGDSPPQGKSNNLVNIELYWCKISIDRETLPLKISLFLYYGAMAAILPYLTIHMLAIGISLTETAIIYLALPFTSFVGPPLMGFLADKLGQYKSVLIVATCANAFFHSLLLAVPHYSETKLMGEVQLQWDGSIGEFRLSPSLEVHCEAFIKHFEKRDWQNSTTEIQSCSEGSLKQLAEFELDGSLWTNEVRGTGESSGESQVYLQGYSENASHKETRISGLFQIQILIELQQTENCSFPLKNEFLVMENVSFLRCLTNIKFDTGVVIVDGSNAITFWSYSLVRIIATIFMSSCYTLLDATTLAIVNKIANADYGTQRIWTVLGTAFASPLAGMLVDSFSNGKPDYSAAFYVANIFFLLNIVSYFIINMDVEKPEENVLKDARQLFRYPEVVVFLAMIFVLGSVWGFVESYLFVFLKDELNAPNYLLGLTLTIGSIAGIPFLYVADTLVRRLGRINVIATAFVVYCVRFVGYSFLTNPWWCFPYEAMEAFTYHLMWTAAATYCAILAPKGLLATLTGIMGALHYSLGKGFGSFIGGYVINFAQIRQAFWDFGLVSGVIGVVYFVINYIWLRKLVKERQKSNGFFDPKYGGKYTTVHTNPNSKQLVSFSPKMSKTQEKTQEIML